jgi:hypothetical protein
MKAYVEATETCLEKMEANQEILEAKINANKEEFGAYQHKTEAVAEQYKQVPRLRAKKLLIASQGRASDFLHGVPKGVTYEGTIGTLENRYGDQHLVAAYHTQLKTKVLATAIEQLIHRAFSVLHEDHVRRGASKAPSTA